MVDYDSSVPIMRVANCIKRSPFELEYQRTDTVLGHGSNGVVICFVYGLTFMCCAYIFVLEFHAYVPADVVLLIAYIHQLSMPIQLL